MVDEHVLAKLEKPAYVRYQLHREFYQVLTIDIPVGEVVEYGLDWVVDMVDVLRGFANDNSLRCTAELNALQDRLDDIVKTVSEVMTKVGEPEGITLNKYYDLKFTHNTEIKDLLMLYVNPIWDRLSVLEAYQEAIEGDIASLEEDVQTQVGGQNIFTFIGHLILHPRDWFKDRLEDFWDVTFDKLEEIFERYW